MSAAIKLSIIQTMQLTKTIYCLVIGIDEKGQKIDKQQRIEIPIDAESHQYEGFRESLKQEYQSKGCAVNVYPIAQQFQKSK